MSLLHSVREYPHNMWPYMVQYLHFRALKFSLIWSFRTLLLFCSASSVDFCGEIVGAGLAAWVFFLRCLQLPGITMAATWRGYGFDIRTAESWPAKLHLESLACLEAQQMQGKYNHVVKDKKNLPPVHPIETNPDYKFWSGNIYRFEQFFPAGHSRLKSPTRISPQPAGTVLRHPQFPKMYSPTIHLQDWPFRQKQQKTKDTRTALKTRVSWWW